MTSEVAVMNKEAIALAADSAVTLTHETGQKIFTSANKIFTLSKYQPVGVMTYGNANFMGIPWETIIKVYRSKLGQRTFKTLSGYAENFLAFLRADDLFSSNFDKDEEEYVIRSIYWCFRRIGEEINSSNFNLMTRSKLELENISAQFVQGLENSTLHIIQREFNDWNKAETVPSAPTSFADEFRKMYGEAVDQAKSAVLGGFPLTEESSAQLTEIAVNLFLKFPSGMNIPENSGVVFAGFGTDDVFPVLESYAVEGRIGDYVKHRRDEKNCVRIGGSERAEILPFAQKEMVETFMEGIDPEYQLLIEKFVKDLRDSIQKISADEIVKITYDPEAHYDDPLFEEDLEIYLSDDRWTEIRKTLNWILQSNLDQFLSSLSKHRHSRHIDPIKSVVQGLPKDELAAMAESLINLTSFKRKVSMQAETVGGPIDVAVISKGDGFIWIKRKRYFEGEMNPQFFANYYR